MNDDRLSLGKVTIVAKHIGNLGEMKLSWFHKGKIRTREESLHEKKQLHSIKVL